MDNAVAKPKVQYKVLPRAELRRIEPLWEKLNDHHLKNSTHFSDYYGLFSFKQRMEKFQDPQLKMRIEVAIIDSKTIGYSLSSITKRAEAVLDSIFIERPYRRLGIGTNLAKRAFAWMDEEGALSKSLSVVYGNEEVLPFYRKFNFYPIRTELNQKR